MEVSWWQETSIFVSNSPAPSRDAAQSSRYELLESDVKRRCRLFRRCPCNKGRLHPHLVHFLLICCWHIRCHRISSSASCFQSLLTCTALHKVVASRYWRMRYDTSVGKTAKKSIRISALTDVEICDNCEKQHFASMPSIRRLRSFSEAFEKNVQVESIRCWLLRGRFWSSFLF